jgi:hypothetical protein
VATEIYATGVHPYNAESVCVARTPEEKQEQRSFFFWYKPEMKAALRASMQRLGLDAIAHRLLDEKRRTRDVTPSPHIAPCGAKLADLNPGARLAAATKGAKKPMLQTQPPAPTPVPSHAPARAPKAKKPTDLDKLLRESGVKLPEKK